jgi:hypothetical protein
MRCKSASSVAKSKPDGASPDFLLIQSGLSTA